MKYIVEFYTGSERKRWTNKYASVTEAWIAIHERRLVAPHIQRRVTPVSE